MPLTDLIRYFNVADNTGESTLYLEEKKAAAWHVGLRLTSLFQPIVDLQRERVVGHQAILHARREDGTTISPAEAYALCETPESVVHFDRLCRTLHALNFLAQQQHTGGYLQLSVHPRHLLAVQSQHGLVYEAILKRCGLGPEDIVLQIDASSAGRNPRLAEALANYRQRGYRLAIAGLGSALAVDELLLLEPDILQLRAVPEVSLIEAGDHGDVVLEVNGIETGAEYTQARTAGIALGQGALFGPPQSACRPTHGKGRVAYNL